MNQELIRSVESQTTGGLALDAVSHGFDGTSVLHEITLELDRGEILAIIGPSGTGKTTMLRLLALFHSPETGTVQIDGTNPWNVAERERLALRRQLAMVFQKPNLFDATVRRNVEYGRHIRQPWNDRIRQWVSRFRGDDMESTVAEALDVVGLAAAGDQAAPSLSGGEAQRVAFARALAYEPEFLLLDEPTSDLDPRNTAVIEEAIRTVRDRGLGVVVATHDMHQAERIADRVAVLIGGELIEVGPTDRLFSDPTDHRVRQFIEGELVY